LVKFKNQNSILPKIIHFDKPDEKQTRLKNPNKQNLKVFQNPLQRIYPWVCKRCLCCTI